MEKYRSNWIYVLGSEQDGDLVNKVREGLNKIGNHPICSPERDVGEGDPTQAKILAVRRSVAVVVLARPELYRESLTSTLLDTTVDKVLWPARIVYVALNPHEGRLEAHEWPIHVIVKKNVSTHRLIGRINHAISKVLWYVSGVTRKPGGKRGRNAFLSYSAKNTILKNKILRNLSQMGLKVWEYGNSPRNVDLHYRDEIADAIQRSRVVVFFFTAAWEQSPECQREYRIARKASRDCIWLRCDRAKIPSKLRRDDQVFDIRPHKRGGELEQLEKLLFPSRGQSKLSSGAGSSD